METFFFYIVLTGYVSHSESLQFMIEGLGKKLGYKAEEKVYRIVGDESNRTQSEPPSPTGFPKFLPSIFNEDSARGKIYWGKGLRLRSWWKLKRLRPPEEAEHEKNMKMDWPISATV